MAWTPADLGAVTHEFPSLVVVDAGSISGNLNICGAMRGGTLVLNPSETDLLDAEAQATFLVDSFRVEISSDPRGPHLKVLGSRIPETAVRLGLELIDLHVYSDQSVCFAAPQQIEADWASGMAPIEFTRRYVLPFLYQQAFFDRHGRWPWGELAHGSLGLLEWLGRKSTPTNGDVMRTILWLEASGEKARKLIQHRARRHHRCPCGSGKQLRDCHPDLKPGIDIVRSWIAQGKGPRLRKLLVH